MVPFTFPLNEIASGPQLMNRPAHLLVVLLLLDQSQKLAVLLVDSGHQRLAPRHWQTV